jgi:hypothetical protein
MLETKIRHNNVTHFSRPWVAGVEGGFAWDLGGSTFKPTTDCKPAALWIIITAKAGGLYGKTQKRGRKAGTEATAATKRYRLKEGG